MIIKRLIGISYSIRRLIVLFSLALQDVALHQVVWKQLRVGGLVVDLASSLRNSPNPCRKSPILTSNSLAICPMESPFWSFVSISSSDLSILSAIITAATN
jgi:hypothetical protein